MRLPRQAKRTKLYLLIVVIILVLATGIYFGYKTFTENKITRFDIETENINCTNIPEVTGFLQSLKLSYFYFKSETLDFDLRKKFFCIGKIEQTISYPDKLKLKLYGREGKFIVRAINPPVDTNPQVFLNQDQMNATQSTSQAFPPKVVNQILDSYQDASTAGLMFLVDEEGVVFEEVSSDTAYPKLSLFAKELRVGGRIPDDLIKKTLEITDKLKTMDISTDNLIVVGDRLIVDTIPRITFALNRALDRQSASLQLILRQAKMNLDPEKTDTRSVESVDLRFDRPVVVYSKK